MLFGTPKNPKGPQGRWDKAKIRLSGTILTFELPQTNKYATHGQLEPIQEQNLYAAEQYYINSEKAYKKRPPTSSLCRREWQFDGFRLSTRSGGYGNLFLKVRIDSFPDFSSLFRPRRLECAIERFIYSSGLFRIQPNYNRLNYKLNTNGEQVWSCHEVGNGWQYLCHLPITDEHMLTFGFDMMVYHPKTQVVKAMMALAHKIMGTVKVELSEDAKRMKYEAQTQYPWEALQETLPPYDFEHMEKTHYDDFLRAASVQLNHNSDLPYERFEAIANKMQAQETAKLTAIRERVLASHMRFTELEAQDAKAQKNNG